MIIFGGMHLYGGLYWNLINLSVRRKSNYQVLVSWLYTYTELLDVILLLSGMRTREGFGGNS